MVQTLQKKNMDPGTPVPVILVRVAHALLTCYAVSIMVIVHSTPGYTADFEFSASWAATERVFALAVALPCFLASLFAFLAATVRSFFGTAIFFCFFVAFALLALPGMTDFLFLQHLSAFGLALVYAMTAVILIRYYFDQPVPKRK